MRYLVTSIALSAVVGAGCGQKTFPAGETATSAQPRPANDMAGPPYDKPSDAELRKRLSPIEYEVTQRDGTEPAFRNRYWNNKKVGLYVDVVTGEPLFLSTDKFDSGTGWPSFTRPVGPGRVSVKSDTSLGMTRTEVRAQSGDSHLGHLFDDGPKPTGMRYCINSAALRFVPFDRLEATGYGAYRERLKAAAAK